MSLLLLAFLGYVAYKLFKAFARGKQRNYESSYRTAERETAELVVNGGRQMPSWGFDEEKVDEFINGIVKLSVRRGVPPEILNHLSHEKDFVRMLLGFATSMERQGASFIHQQLAGTDVAVKMCVNFINSVERSKAFR